MKRESFRDNVVGASIKSRKFDNLATITASAVVLVDDTGGILRTSRKAASPSHNIVNQSRFVKASEAENSIFN
jgi:hypothetical protein